MTKQVLVQIFTFRWARKAAVNNFFCFSFGAKTMFFRNKSVAHGGFCFAPRKVQIFTKHFLAKRSMVDSLSPQTSFQKKLQKLGGNLTLF